MKVKRGCAFILVLFLVAVLALFTLAAPVGASYDGGDPGPVMPEWMNSLWIPILCGAPFILGFLCLLGWLSSINTSAPGQEDEDIIHVNPANEDDLHRLYEITNRMYEERSGRRRHDPARVVITGSRADIVRADDYFRAAARQIEREGGEKYKIEYRE